MWGMSGTRRKITTVSNSTIIDKRTIFEDFEDDESTFKKLANQQDKIDIKIMHQCRFCRQGWVTDMMNKKNLSSLLYTVEM